jgi:large subunit ribosomal protein L2
MPNRKYKPTTPSRRFMTVSTFEEITKDKPEKGLLLKKKNSAGRNSAGRITVRHRGGGHKKHIRVVDFLRDKRNIPAKVAAIEYDPNRSARLALLHYADGEKRYILAPVGLTVGAEVMAGSENMEPAVGNAMPLGAIPLGMHIHAIELIPGRGAKVARSAGQEAEIMARDAGYADVKMPSGEIRKISVNCYATIGQVGNVEHESISLGKAGRARWKGRRPTVRGVAMNPVDHPMGGGEGRSSGGSHPVSPWGQLSKGKRTRNKRKASSRFIVQRRRK